MWKSQQWRINHEYINFLKINGSPKLCKYEMKDYRRMKNSQKLRNVGEKMCYNLNQIK